MLRLLVERALGLVVGFVDWPDRSLRLDIRYLICVAGTADGNRPRCQKTEFFPDGGASAAPSPCCVRHLKLPLFPLALPKKLALTARGATPSLSPCSFPEEVLCARVRLLVEEQRESAVSTSSYIHTYVNIFLPAIPQISLLFYCTGMYVVYVCNVFFSPNQRLFSFLSFLLPPRPFGGAAAGLVGGRLLLHNGRRGGGGSEVAGEVPPHQDTGGRQLLLHVVDDGGALVGGVPAGANGDRRRPSAFQGRP